MTRTLPIFDIVHVAILTHIVDIFEIVDIISVNIGDSADIVDKSS